MKSRETKAKDLEILHERFSSSKSAMVLSFENLSVEKDQQFRNELRETGATYSVVKNTLARRAIEGTGFENFAEHLTGVSSVAWTNDEPIDLSKVISKYLKESKDVFAFKTGIIDGKAISIEEVKTIASLPSKEELIGKILFLLNSPAQGVATVLNALPRDLAIVVKQISEQTDDSISVEAAPKAEPEMKSESAAEEKPKVEVEASTEEPAVEEKVAGEDLEVETTLETKEAKSDESETEKAVDEKAETDTKETEEK